MPIEKTTLEAAVELRRELHTHPELSLEEVWTKARLLQFVKDNTTRLEVVDRGNWFYAKYKREEDENKTAGDRKIENICFRADFDALPMDEGITLPWGSKIPGKAHKCGHDGHSSTLMAFAMEVDQKGAPHNIFFLWQPAEETGAGALLCLSMLEEENITRTYGYHNMHGFPMGSVNVMEGVIQCASTGMIIKVTGSPAHASQPETGKNPSLVIAGLVQAIPEMQRKMSSAGLLLCTVVQVNIGNRQFGMSAYYGELLLTIRALYEVELEELRDSIVKLATGSCAASGMTVAFEYEDAFPETRNEKTCVEQVRAVAAAKGVPLNEMTTALRPSEDFGHYGKKRPACYFFIGNGVDYPPIHTEAYDFPDSIISVGVTMFKGLAGM